jgi:hypothetical protein
MLIRKRVSACIILSFLAFSSFVLHAQRAPNSNSYYQQLRNLLPGGEVINVTNLELKRDAATFMFKSGSFAFYGEVNGKVTGAVFRGDGHLHITPPNAEERHNLNLLNHSEEFDEDFDQVVLRFTDGTAAELHKDSTGKGSDDKAFGSAAIDLHNYLRNKLQYNLDLRLIVDVLSPAQGGFFMAAIRGHKDPHLFFVLDPLGVSFVEPEEVCLVRFDDWGPSFLTAFNLASSGSHGGANNEAFRSDHEDLDVTIEKSGFLSGTANVHILALKDGVAVVPLDLYPTLRVSRVQGPLGDDLDFVQEDKDHDADFGVVLLKPLGKGESTTVKVTYGGKDVVENEGNSNYYPVARESWYPNASQGLGDYATYHMTFHVPKGLDLLATGTRVNQVNEGKETTTEWKTDVPLPVIGFNIGQFAMKEATVSRPGGDNLTVDAYANQQPPDMFNAISEGASDSKDLAIGNLGTKGMLPVELSQAQVASQIYTNYFGPLPFSKVAVTQQFACNYGQSWPMLVYLPICGFLDSTQQHELGLHPEDMYWKVVTPHEVAHQWWGQTVGFKSYRDQWMSEGFANASAAIFLLSTRPKPDDYLEFWKQQQRLIVEKNAEGFRPIDVGPVTMGFRLNSQKAGQGVYQDIVYTKGAFIPHMIQMMMWNPREGDAQFKAMMQDFVSSYKLQPATTEDFKAMVEKHMTPGMNMDGNGKMDWFFNEYVYGTELPAYHFEGSATETAQGNSVQIKLVQSGVSANFKALVPVYLELADGHIVRMAQMRMIGDTSYEHTFDLPKLPAPIKKVMINYYYDLLCVYN